MGSMSWLRLSERIKPGENLDRFIPNRSAMDFGYANYMLTQRVTEKENRTPGEEAYLKLLAEALGVNRTRILAFKDKPREKVESIPHGLFSPVRNARPPKPLKPARKTAQMIVEDLDLLDDWYLNLLDWGCNNVLAIGLDNSVFFWDCSNSTGSEFSELVAFHDEIGPVSSVSWDNDGRYLAIGLNNSDVELWDSTTNQLVRILTGCHQSLVSSLAWNNYILTTGGWDGMIVNNDLRVRSHIVGTYKGHNQEVCGLKWSPSGHQLASGGNDNMVYIWDRSMASSNSCSRWLHKLEDHTATVKALAWCPFERNLLASGGGLNDQCIKFWNTHTGASLNSVDTGSEVCALLWNDKEKELMSSHGSPRNQLTLWKYPSMEKTVEFTGHRSRVLYMAQSPNGCTVATASGDQTLRFWSAFTPAPKLKKASPIRKEEPFQHFSRIR